MVSAALIITLIVMLFLNITGLRCLLLLLNDIGLRRFLLLLLYLRLHDGC